VTRSDGPYQLTTVRSGELGPSRRYSIKFQRISSARKEARRILHEHAVVHILLEDQYGQVRYFYHKTIRGGYMTPKHHEIRVTGEE
jgi:hypothetical protein